VRSINSTPFLFKWFEATHANNCHDEAMRLALPGDEVMRLNVTTYTSNDISWGAVHRSNSSSGGLVHRSNISSGGLHGGSSDGGSYGSSSGGGLYGSSSGGFYDEGVQRPCFPPSVLGWMDTGGMFIFTLGTVAYNACLCFSQCSLLILWCCRYRGLQRMLQPVLLPHHLHRHHHAQGTVY
jgi:hypothetical protein